MNILVVLQDMADRSMQALWEPYTIAMFSHKQLYDYKMRKGWLTDSHAQMMTAVYTISCFVVAKCQTFNLSNQLL